MLRNPSHRVALWFRTPPSVPKPAVDVMADRRIIAVAGAGIAGLTVALLLERQGYRVLVFEQTEAPAATGAGIQISPNAFKVLESLGLGRAMRTASQMPSCIQLGDGPSGRPITEYPMGRQILERHKAPYLQIHRVDFAHILKAACDDREDVEIIYNHKITDLASHANGITVLTESNRRFEEYQARAIIGADGVWSNLRRFVYGAQKPEFSGRIAWRALFDMETIPDELSREATGLWLGKDAHLVHYPLRQGRMMNVVAITPVTAGEVMPRGWLEEGPTSQRTEWFHRWAPTLESLILRRANWGGWPIYTTPKIGKLANGPLCLIGDAAHAMAPFAAQGGASAIEDAAILASLCGQAQGDLPAAFLRYEKQRTPRLKKLVALSEANRRIYHMGFPGNQFRNIYLKMASKERLHRRMDWVYGWEPNIPPLPKPGLFTKWMPSGQTDQ